MMNPIDLSKIKVPEEKTAQIVIVASYNVFIELAEMIKYSLNELGIKKVGIFDSVDLKPDNNNFTFSFIIRAFRKFSTFGLPGYKILFQTEECWNDRANGVYRYDFIQGSNRILEMYDENCKLQSTGKVRYCPVGYSPIWEREMPRVQEDIDILFFGSLTPRREKFLNSLRSKYNVRAYRDIFGKERDELINRSKITLNIKAHDKWSYGPLHCLPAQCNKKFMMAEKADGGYGPFVPNKHIIEYDGLNDLHDKVDMWMRTGRNDRDDFARTAYEDMVRTCDFTKILKGAIGDLL